MCGLPASGPRRRAATHLPVIKKYVLRARAPRAPSTHVQYSRSPLSIGTFPDHVTACHRLVTSGVSGGGGMHACSKPGKTATCRYCSCH
ncbi:unnamed protein product, partial [Staurois parvus]